MKNTFTILAIITFLTFSTKVRAQESNKTPEKFRLITGIRVNPLLIYDLEGGHNEKVLHLNRLYSRGKCYL